MTVNRDYAEESESVQPLEFPVYTTPMPLQIHHVTLTVRPLAFHPPEILSCGL